MNNSAKKIGTRIDAKHTMILFDDRKKSNEFQFRTACSEVSLTISSEHGSGSSDQGENCSQAGERRNCF
jgi:hypothetical protein